MAFLLPFFAGFGTASASGAGIASSMAAAGSLIGTGTAAGIGAGVGMGLGAITPGLATVGSILNVASALGQARGIEDAARYNAGMAISEASSRETLIRKSSDRQLGTIRSQIGKSGATGQGTPLMVLAESAANSEIDALNARMSGFNQATLYGMQGANARRAGNLQAGASLLSGIGKIT
jgi:hypothetical protein